MPDFATSWFSTSSVSGVTKNPYDLSRDPGGSSSGTAAAIGLVVTTSLGWQIDPPPPGFTRWALDHISLAYVVLAALLAVVLLRERLGALHVLAIVVLLVLCIVAPSAEGIGEAVVEVKEIKIRPKTDDHDIEVKIRATRKFLEAGNKVKVICRFRGREIMHPQRAQMQLNLMLSRIEDIANVETRVA